MHELNVLDLEPQRFGMFDVILFSGVLYQLRYPFWGLAGIIRCLKESGILLVESGMLADPRLKYYDLLYCPVETSPYEDTSCTFFNEHGFVTTMCSFHCKLLYSKSLDAVEQAPPYKHSLVNRIKRPIKELVALPQSPPAEPARWAVDRHVFIF